MTTRPPITTLPEGALRYCIDDTDVFSVVAGRGAPIDNLAISRKLELWIKAWDVDLVHFHAIQHLGMGMTRICQALGVPYVITLHDCWWLSDELFIQTDDDRYHLYRSSASAAPQGTTLDRYLRARRVLSRHALEGAAAILSPSEEHKAFYVRNGVPEDKITINRNGFTWPSRSKRKRSAPSTHTPKLTFCFVGGPNHIKGYDLIRKVFEQLESSHWELRLVDITLKLGYSSIDVSEWSVKGCVRAVPPYRQNELDRFYDDVDVLLFPSQWKESYGLSVREALARDVWVIATEPGGQAEEIIEGVNGNLIPMTYDPTPLLRAVESVLKQADKFATYVNPFKDRLPTYTTQAEALAALYTHILQRPRQNAELTLANSS